MSYLGRNPSRAGVTGSCEGSQNEGHHGVRPVQEPWFSLQSVLSELSGWGEGRSLTMGAAHALNVAPECGPLEPDVEGGFITTIWTLWRHQLMVKSL